MDDWLERFARANFARSADTAHDLKTPLNVAVLNLELLRMRMRKLAGDDDEKLAGYAKAIELELRRMGRIFDAFFLLSTPPKDEPVPVDLAAICAEAGGTEVGEPFLIRAHETRIRQAFKMFFEGSAALMSAADRRTEVSRSADFAVTQTGTAVAADLDVSKIFKFYYTDPNGNPDLSLATARLIVETYGGVLSAENDRDKVLIRMVLPGDR
ncbi:MAG TPA: histidine kinase dimerization/phospho-acceptor domain-containing protein [Thermoanaerobaculia bacterium]|jgi:nitrogen fixation/metabolism regulation signal transduction histidine kinase|nr:histidine kinase dimerization/phospho-acceptor domain-containing protein [Thermoanaerobaculia bacterium]